MSQPIALVDCNRFYVACEEVFQPKLRRRPVVVLSNNDGCVISRSDEAKALGIKMGDAYHLRQAEFARWRVHVRSSNYTLYGDMSARAMRVLSDFSPDVEVYSIDEAFLDLSGFPDLEEHGRKIRAAMSNRLQLPVCVGISTTKTLAKVANRTAKKDPASGGVCYLPDERAQTAALAQMDLADVWGVGHRLQVRLAEIGITTPLQLRDACPTMIRERFNVVLQRTVLELQGTPCLELEHDTPDSKTICTSRSFGRSVETFHEMAEALTAYTSRAADKLRRQGLAAASVVVLVSTNKWKPEDPPYYATHHVPLTIGTSDTGRLIRAAMHGLRRIYRPGFRYKKTGILLLGLHPASQVQGSLFIRPDTPERVALMGAIDGLNARFGRDRVRYAISGMERGWKLKAEFHSPRYTTQWAELLQV